MEVSCNKELNAELKSEALKGELYTVKGCVFFRGQRHSFDNPAANPPD